MRQLSPFAFFLLAGLAIYLISTLWIVILAFRTNFFLGCACLFFPVAQPVYAALNWKQARWPFVLQLGAIGLIGVTVFAGLHTEQIPSFRSEPFSSNF